MTLTSWIGCVWLGLKLNSAGRKISRNQIKDLCSTPILLCAFRQRYTNPHTHKACCHLQNPFRNMLLVRNTEIPALSSQLFLTKGTCTDSPRFRKCENQHILPTLHFQRVNVLSLGVKTDWGRKISSAGRPQRRDTVENYSGIRH